MLVVLSKAGKACQVRKVIWHICWCSSWQMAFCRKYPKDAHSIAYLCRATADHMGTPSGSSSYHHVPTLHLMCCSGHVHPMQTSPMIIGITQGTICGIHKFMLWDTFLDWTQDKLSFSGFLTGMSMYLHMPFYLWVISFDCVTILSGWHKACCETISQAPWTIWGDLSNDHLFRFVTTFSCSNSAFKCVD